MSAGDDPRAVAVVIPVWDDYVRWLPEAVESVLAQGVAEQMIVVDNASAVAVPQLPGTTVVRAPQRLSTGSARNLGLEAVRTPLVVFLDADDLMLPGALEALVAGLTTRPDAVALGMARIDADTGERHRSPRKIAPILARWPRLFALANSIWSLVPTQGTMVMRTDIVRAAGGYGDRSQGEDWVLGAALSWRGAVAFDEHIALVYRWRDDSPGQSQARLTLRANARCVRERLRMNTAAAGTRMWMPLIAGLQWVTIALVRPLFIAARRLVS
jgi:glycosyltransferase involved in cell wall biosynthesis